MPDKVFSWVSEHLRDVLLIVVLVLQAYGTLSQNDALMEAEVKRIKEDVNNIKRTRFTNVEAESLTRAMGLQMDAIQLQLKSIKEDVNEIKQDVRDSRKSN